MTRIGAVSYLNTKPLIHQMRDALGDQDSLSLNLPSRLASQLAAGDLDVALIPSVEYFRGQKYRIVSDAVIACTGPVWSVRLVSRVPIQKIRRLALDEGSRTSAALVRVLLWEICGLKPETVMLPIEQSPDAADADGVLIIGDRAMHPEHGVYEEIWDLGQRWTQHTGLPFVFAMWVASELAEVDHLVPIFESCRDSGLAAVESIAETHAAANGLTNHDLLRYFTENLHFRLGSRERQGLERFRRSCGALGLIPQPATNRA